MTERRRISYAPSPVAPSSFRGSPEHVQAESHEEDEAATVIWQGGRSALPSRHPSQAQFQAPPSQRWNETPMAFEPAPARVPTAMPSISPMEMDMQVVQGPAPRNDVLAWLPLASISCVGVAIAGLLFAVALTSFRNHETASNAAAGATIANVMPLPAKMTAPPLMPVIEPVVSEPVSAPMQPIMPNEDLRAIAPLAVTTITPKTISPATTAPATTAPATTARAMTAAATTAPATPRTAAPIARTDRTDRSVIVPVEQPAKKTAAPRVDDEAASAQRMLEEAQRETSGAL